MERNEFEKSWKKAFDGAEATPAESSWSAIESALIAAENSQMKRQVVFYQRLAAASVIFAALITASGFYYWSNNVATISKLPSRTRTALGKQGAKMAKRKR